MPVANEDIGKNFSLPWKKLFSVLVLSSVLIYFIPLFSALISYKNDLRTQLIRVLEMNRSWNNEYFERYKEFPILKDGNVSFWDLQTSEFIWKLRLHSISNVGTSSVGDAFKKNHGWSFLDSETGDYRQPDAGFPPEFLNPITGKFDWLAEDEKGRIYSASMPDSILIASPPIRVVNIRCPLTASDPPFFEDLTKW